MTRVMTRQSTYDMKHELLFVCYSRNRGIVLQNALLLKQVERRRRNCLAVRPLICFFVSQCNMEEEEKNNLHSKRR